MFYDYAIIIALQEERDYFFEALSQPVQVVHEDDLLINPLYLSLKNKDRVTGAVCCVGEMGLAPATNLTQRVLHVLHPRLIISLGLSGIINPDLHLGDTVIGLSSHHYLHEAAAVGNPQASSETPFGGAIALQGDTLKPSKDLIDLLTDFRSSFVDAYRKWQDIAAEELSRLIDVNTISKLQGASLISDFVRLKVGHLACGELVIANTKAKDWLESIKRKFAAVDMESWGVLKACEHDPRISTVIIRCICDAADERKKELESETKDMLRRWTLHNGARFTRELLATLVLTDSGFHAPMGDRSNTQDSPEAKLHSTVEQNFLPLYGQQAKDTLGDVTAHERLFSSLSQWEVKPDDPGLFTAFKRSIEVSAEPDIEGVVGQPGTGKTSLMVAFYGYLRTMIYAPGERQIIPVFLSCARFQRREVAQEKVTLLKTVLLEAMHLRPQAAVWLLIDDIDGYEELITTFINDTLPGAVEYNRCVRTIRADREPEYGIIQLRRVFSQSEAVKGLVAAFCRLYNIKNELLLASELKASKLTDIDLFSMYIYGREIKRGRFTVKLTQLLENYVLAEARKLGIPMPDRDAEKLFASTGELALLVKMRKAVPPAEDIHLQGLMVRLIKKHDLIADFLVARHMIVQFVRASELAEPDQRFFSYVYPHSINRLAVNLLTEGGVLNLTPGEIQARTLLTIRTIAWSTRFTFLARAHACYLLGRMTERAEAINAKTELLKILKEIKNGAAKARGYQAGLDNPFALRDDATKEEKEQYLLFKRTVYISLAYLEDNNAEDEYIGSLIADKDADLINRGFHLEYYGDIEFNFERPLVSKDDLNVFPKTLSELSSRLARPGGSKLFQIEAYTVASLAQQRHVRRKLNEEDRQSVATLLKKVLGGNGLQNQELRSYLELVCRHLEYKTYLYAISSLKFLRLKHEKRAGWGKRGIVEGVESVASHTMGAYLL